MPYAVLYSTPQPLHVSCFNCSLVDLINSVIPGSLPPTACLCLINFLLCVVAALPGSFSKEMRVFNAALAALERGERPKPELSAFGGDLRGQGEAQIRDWGLDEEDTEELFAPSDDE